jgi:hypothetical protein
MQYLKIQNAGLLDIRLIHLMGGTTKSDDESKIGQFGTGLKYTLAYLVRNNLDFHIYIGGKKINISTESETIRDTEFKIITIDGQRSSITSMVGKEWEAWMIIRELWCNAIDEGGNKFEVVEIIEPSEVTTEFYIQLTGDIKEVYENWNKYFIHDIKPLQEHEDFNLYPGGYTLKIYKNGVLIKELDKQKSVFSYDYKNACLNELREFNGSITHFLVTYVLPSLNKKSVETFINNIKGTYEEDMDYDWTVWDGFGEGWDKALGKAKFIDYDSYKQLEARDPEAMKEISVVQVPKGLFKKLIEYKPSFSMLRVSDKVNTFYETYSDKLNDKINKCLEILESVGYFVDPELKILTGVFGCKSTRACIHFDSKEIHVSQDMESMSDSDLIVALIEENEHYKTGYGDMTRDFQTHLLKLYSNILLKDVKVLL